MYPSVDLKNADWVPHQTSSSISGKGVTMQRTDLKAADGIPYVSGTDAGGKGITVQKAALKAQDGIPNVATTGNGNPNNGRGVVTRSSPVLDGSRLLPWMAKLSERLSNVIVLRRSWESGVTNPMTTYRAKCAVFLDPPYLTAERSSDMYGSDRQGTSDDAARASYKWAVEHGGDPRFRIAYCCHEGDFPRARRMGCFSHAGSAASGAQIASTGRNQVMFSPHCEGAEQADLFA